MIQTLKQYIENSLLTKAFSITKGRALMLVLLLVGVQAFAQQSKVLTLNEAISLGIENSKNLKLSRARIDEAVAQYNITKDNNLPTASASYAYNHAEILTNTFKIGDGPDSSAIHLPSRADAFIGTLSVQELIFAGNKLKYAKESTDLLTKVARLDAEKDKDDIIYTIVNAYYNLYRVQQSKKVVVQDMEAIDRQLKQAERFFEQGVVTKNDVLRFQLQKSNVELTGIDLETNRRIINYNLDILLGLPESTELSAADFSYPAQQTNGLTTYLDSALANRQEIKNYDLRTLLAETSIKSIKADLSPTLGVGASMYYINASGQFIPPANTFLAPISVGATLAWNFDRLWLNKNKIAEAKIQKNQVEIGKTISIDQVKNDVNRNYQSYQMSLDKIRVLETAINQATENDKILESKYKNNVASVTDRIDAQTQLFQTLINLELAKADAGLAYYSLLKSTGTINKTK